MPAFELTPPPQAYATWRATRPMTHPVVAMWSRVSAWIDRAGQRRALAELDDDLLRDIGITRYDAARESRKPFWR